MQEPTVATQTSSLRWRGTAARSVGALGAVTFAAAGLLFSRADVVALALPLAIWTVLAGRPPAATAKLRVHLTAEAPESSRQVLGLVEASSDAEIVQMSVVQGGVHQRTVEVSGREGIVRSQNKLLHSGPLSLLRVHARMLATDGAWVSEIADGGELIWHAAPVSKPLPALPLAPRLRGLHGSHEGERAGVGGDFRDLHPFAPGDELRRVDWRATARLARRSGDLFIRRTNALSDASIAIMIDTSDDLGSVVATWGAELPERSGPTSLDLAREAGRSVAAAAIAEGDRVALHELHPAGLTLRSGTGSRHLSRIVSNLAAMGPRDIDPTLRRTPPVPAGSVIYLLSTFFARSAASMALNWRSAGHRVIAIDTLPAPDLTQITPQLHTTMRILLAERKEVFRTLENSGVEVLTWRDDPVVSLRAIGKVRR